MSSPVELVFRHEWGRAVAVLTRLTGDLGLAEDAVQEAFAQALDRWATGPLPSDPAGWLIAVAKNHAVDRIRREARRPAKRRPPRGCSASGIPRRPQDGSPTTGSGSSSPAATRRSTPAPGSP